MADSGKNRDVLERKQESAEYADTATVAVHVRNLWKSARKKQYEVWTHSQWQMEGRREVAWDKRQVFEKSDDKKSSNPTEQDKLAFSYKCDTPYCVQDHKGYQLWYQEGIDEKKAVLTEIKKSQMRLSRADQKIFQSEMYRKRPRRHYHGRDH